ncbi:metallophosphoesterase [Clostridium saccharoperbutylacetonicum]|uniref:metallophosphoesterase n=1 Tax=Clostridium saccharoperbutylacetonicum TaxID=36745 RepID=UPI00098393A8|nr:metallophosphoesterase [Clostridium saccharoperbutylacetonicum]AQR94707.1 calcineurin-like phosphoesterase superfamily domain protein [Clostridium saccharoperbutylacetonicum]NSB30548.1 UDP-2,3-diacylglucosamine pyrophosphatase LpxH [Clostridium saccharoperbutylacetonicum]
MILEKKLAKKRLTEAYNNAKIEYFDDNSKYIFFSDCHRGDSTPSDEFAKNQNIFLFALEFYFNNGYTYVEVGDGDELWEHSNFKHIRLAHDDVYSILKKFFNSDRLIMLYGNHNIQLKYKNFVEKNYYKFYDDYNEEEIELFPNLQVHESVVFKHKDTGQEILTVHGHQGDIMNDKIWFFTRLTVRYFWRFLHSVGFINPASPVKSSEKIHKIERIYSNWIKTNKIMIICGHTHRPHFPKVNEIPYFNDGSCVRASGIQGIEIVNGQIMLIEWKIRTSSNGSLHIKRKILRGPEPIATFDLRTSSC